MVEFVYYSVKLFSYFNFCVRQFRSKAVILLFGFCFSIGTYVCGSSTHLLGFVQLALH
jgi:hypothetical protein